VDEPPRGREEEPTAAVAAESPPERPFRGPLESALRHPFLVIVPVVVLVGIAAVIGYTRDPTYTAEARVNVGRIDVPAYTLQGVIIGNATLASGYSRTIGAEPVVGPAANAVGLSPDEARDRLTASPIPESTLIRVEAEGPDEPDAVRLANAGARSLINYVEDLNRAQETSGALRQFRTARARVERARTALERLQRNPNPSIRRVERARLELAAATLQAETIGNQYRALQGGPEAQDLLQFVAPAAEADSDRRSVFQRLILIGLAAGLLVGLLLALLRENAHLIGRSGT
jgi:capsular polysaccharide biosynthesis protein